MKKLFLLGLAFVFMLVAMPVMAQVDAVPTLISAEPVPELADVAESFELEGLDVDEISEVPSGIGLWWRNVRETVSLGLTFNPVKKAEKALVYAEERMRIAEVMSEKANDPKVQERASKMIEKAQGLMAKVEAGKEKWMAADDNEKKKMLMKNVANFQVKKEQAMDRIEERIPEEKQEKFNELREKGLQGSQRLMNALENGEIPEDVKAKIQAVKVRVEAHAETVKKYIEERKEIHERIKTGDPEAREELKALNESRKEEIRGNMETYREVKTQLREQAQDGDEAAQKKLQIMNRVENAVQTRVQERVENATTSAPARIQERMEQRIENGGAPVGTSSRPVPPLMERAPGNKIPLSGEKPTVDTMTPPGGLQN